VMARIWREQSGYVGLVRGCTKLLKKKKFRGDKGERRL